MADRNDTTPASGDSEAPLNSEAADWSAPAEPAGDLETARAEAQDWRDKFLRKLAEFDNFRKRTRQESESVWQRATESAVLGILPAMDDIERMLESTADPEDFYRKGAEMIAGKMRAWLEANGVTKFESKGAAFDPAQHDAIMLQPIAGFPAGTVLNVITPGYKMGDRVIRHAQVIVSAEPEDATE
jgi:molecular chaperone GrpE